MRRFRMIGPLGAIVFLLVAWQASPLQRSEGGDRTCGGRDDGTVACWGSSVAGTADGQSNAPTDIAGLSGVTTVDSGGVHACASAASRVHCWGWNGDGQLGTGSSDSFRIAVPRTLNKIAGASVIAAGGRHTCAVQDDGSVWCWGAGNRGQILNGTSEFESPRNVQVLSGLSALDADSDYNCGIRTGGQVVCWGDNVRGQVSGAPGSAVTTPKDVPGLNNAVSIATGSNHACAALATGRVSCWGSNEEGALGYAKAPKPAGTPVLVPRLAGVVEVSAGRGFSCARTKTGRVMCWGANGLGYLGSGDPLIPSPTPLPVAGLNDAVAISSGYSHTCAVRATGQIVCWGSNRDGQLGNGTRAIASATPVVVRGFEGTGGNLVIPIPRVRVPAPTARVTRTGERLRLAVSARFERAAIGRRVRIEYRRGKTWIATAPVQIAQNGRISRTIVLTRANAGGARVRTLPVRLVLVRSGRSPQVVGTPRAARVPG
ncbi:MAG TPA: hypothetical protein PKE32_05485 [Miltoncostaeaceae bacterium]|nr:hypothetical protein [Miltoncostaeaceae bacterium]